MPPLPQLTFCTLTKSNLYLVTVTWSYLGKSINVEKRTCIEKQTFFKCYTIRYYKIDDFLQPLRTDQQTNGHFV